MAIIQFFFIVALPLVIVAGGLVTLFAVGALFDALENPGDLLSRVEGAFTRAPQTRPLPADHYYQAPWAAEKRP